MGSDSTDSLVHVDSAARLSRREAIEQAARARDVSRLRRLADEPGGFEDDELRRLAW